MTTGEKLADQRAEHSAWFYLRLGLSGGLMVLVLGIAAILVVIPKITGAVPLTILTSSMEPGLPPGTLIVVLPLEPGNIAIGDVVTYQIKPGDPALITHRVIGVQFTADGTRQFTFQGDNNGAPDADLVREEQIRGRLWYSVPLIGYLSLFMNGDARGVLLPVGATALFLYAAVSMAIGARDGMATKNINRAREAVAAGLPPFERQ